MISVEDAEKVDTLTVTKVNLHVMNNSIDNHTLFYHCTKGDNAQCVVRRGQEFVITLTFSRAYDKKKDDLIFIFDAGMCGVYYISYHGS
jgi:hypothetical protein